jgi:hypothetical protein
VRPKKASGANAALQPAEQSNAGSADARAERAIFVEAEKTH